MVNRILFWAMVLQQLISGSAMAQTIQDTSVIIEKLATPDLRAYDELQLPKPGAIKPVKQVVVAIVDDGFNLNHQDCKNYFYRNSKEIPGNNTDDDKNGYIDDLCGYDVADDDNDVSIPKGRETYFYHGTMLAGIITRLAEQCLGPNASTYIKILPVKAMRDKSGKPYMDAGYEGISYAVKSGADIILCAWNGGKFDAAKYQAVFDEARKKGITIIAAAGNTYAESIDPPASLSTVYAVASVDTALKKMKNSNYGTKVDLVAAGQNVYTAYPLKNDFHFYGSGTSSASALAAGCAAMLKLAAPHAQPYELMEALKNTARPLDSLNRYYGGKLGAGLPQLNNALVYLLNEKARPAFFSPSRPVGNIILDKGGKSWLLQPAGGYRAYTFTLAGKVKNGSTARLNFYNPDTLYAGYLLSQFPLRAEVAGESIRVSYEGKNGSEPLVLRYAASPVDSPNLFCSGTQEFTSPAGEFSDGSGDADYANNCSCKWLITVPEGKHIRIEFDKFDTQSKTDLVFIYQGSKTLSENLIARFSGPNLPPIVTTGYNQALIWFVTDPTITGKGWHLKYEATDSPPGAVAPKK